MQHYACTRAQMFLKETSRQPKTHVGVPMSPKRPFLQNVRNGQNRPFWLVKWTKMVIVTYLECPRSRGGCPEIGGQTRQNGRFY